MATKTNSGRGISDVEASDIAKELRLAAARVCDETSCRSGLLPFEKTTLTNAAIILRAIADANASK